MTTTDLEITIESLRPSYEYSVTVAATTVADGPFSSEFIVPMPESCNNLSSTLPEMIFPLIQAQVNQM